MFYVNLPFGLLALASCSPNCRSARRLSRRFDLFGFALLGLALASLQLMLDRGNQLDWFQSREIWIYAFVALSSAWMVVIHFATARNPLFDSSLFADRNFALALMFMVAIGVVMFANMALMPPMLQRLFGYSVIDTGLVLMPRGVGVLVSMQVSGLLMRRGVDARLMVATGFIVTAFSQLQMAHWSLAADVSHFVSAGLIQGLGMGLVFIPLNVTAFSTLPPQLRTDGSSLLNLARSLGASVGISITTILLAANVQRGHEEIGSHITGASVEAIDLSTVDRYQSAADVVMRMLDNEVNRQAAMVAYVDDFYMMMWLALAAVPLAVFMRRAPARRRASADGPLARDQSLLLHPPLGHGDAVLPEERLAVEHQRRDAPVPASSSASWFAAISASSASASADCLGIEFGQIEPGARAPLGEVLALVPVLRPAPDQPRCLVAKASPLPRRAAAWPTGSAGGCTVGPRRSGESRCPARSDRAAAGRTESLPSARRGTCRRIV